MVHPPPVVIPLLLVLSCHLLCVCSSSGSGSLVHDRVDRVYDLSTQVTKLFVAAVLVNEGEEQVKDYLIPIQNPDHLSWIDAEDGSGAILPVIALRDHQHKEATECGWYSVHLVSPLEPGGTVKVLLNIVWTHEITATPSSVAQKGKNQSVGYHHGNHYYFSPFGTRSQVTLVKVSGPLQNMEAFNSTSPAPFSTEALKSGTVGITYGPYEAVQPFTVSPMELTFDASDVHFLTAMTLVREVELSHWGNVAVREKYRLRNDAVQWDAPFSRYDILMGDIPGVVSTLAQHLPAGASDLCFRDELGNISAASLSRRNERGVKLDFSPRFPLLGGWKTEFEVLYNLPIQLYLAQDINDTSNFIFNMTFANTLEGTVVDNYILKVILPEGAYNMETQLPFPVDNQELTLHFSHLDMSGRPVIMISKKNVIYEHNKFFQLTYNFQKRSMLQEPLILAMSYFIILLSIMVYIRFLNPAKDQVKSEDYDVVSDLLFQVTELMKQRQMQHDLLDSALAKSTKGRNIVTYTTEKQRVETNLARCKREMLSLYSKAEEVDREIGTGLAQKMKDLETLEERKSTQQGLNHDLEISFRIRKTLSKAAYEQAAPDMQAARTHEEENFEIALSELTQNMSG